MKKRLIFLLLSLLSYQLHAQPLPELRQFVMTDRIEAEITTIKNAGKPVHIPLKMRTARFGYSAVEFTLITIN